MSKYGFDLHELLDETDCIEQLALYLNKGQLGLILGGGASIALGFPGWEELVGRCMLMKESSFDVSSVNSETVKSLSNDFKEKCANEGEYLRLVKEGLYKGVSFDFNLAKKELLIAITSLMIGKVRGNVRDIITFNFDSALEWYLNANGLDVNVVSLKYLANKVTDINIFHLHGYLPHDASLGTDSDNIVFTEDEFNVRERGQSVMKDLMNDFFKRHIFLSVGLSIWSVIKDIIPYLQVLDNQWYGKEAPERGHLYGVAFVTNCDSAQQEKCIKNGIVPLVISDKPTIPTKVFEIARTAMNPSVPKSS